MHAKNECACVVVTNNLLVRVPSVPGLWIMAPFFKLSHLSIWLANYIFFYEWNNLDIYIECTNLIDMCSEVKTKFPVPKKSCLSIWGTVISHEAWAPGVWSWECTLHYNSANLGCDRPRCSVLTLSTGRAPASPAPARPAPALSSQHPNHASTD